GAFNTLRFFFVVASRHASPATALFVASCCAASSPNRQPPLALTASRCAACHSSSFSSSVLLQFRSDMRLLFPVLVVSPSNHSVLHNVDTISDEDKELTKLLTGYQDMVGLLNIQKVARMNTQMQSEHRQDFSPVEAKFSLTKSDNNTLHMKKIFSSPATEFSQQLTSATEFSCYFTVLYVIQLNSASKTCCILSLMLTRAHYNVLDLSKADHERSKKKEYQYRGSSMGYACLAEQMTSGFLSDCRLLLEINFEYTYEVEASIEEENQNADVESKPTVYGWELGMEIDHRLSKAQFISPSPIWYCRQEIDLFFED
ncbi:hypothetical protein V2J09_008798, partial [Rumex salicifolius]